MLSTRVIMPLALASAAFMWGCQEPASSPTGPNADAVAPNLGHRGRAHGKPGGDEDPPAEPPTLDFVGGMVTGGFAVTVTERKNLLKAENTDFMQSIQMNFTDPGVCEGLIGTKSGVLPSTEKDENGSSEFDLLVAELSSSLVRTGFFIMKIDKTGLEEGGLPTTSEIHFLDVERDGTFFDDDVGSTRILLGSPFNEVGDATVKWISSTKGKDVFEFTGPVVVWASKVGGGGGSKSDRIIYCDGGGQGPGKHPNKVTVTVNR